MEQRSHSAENSPKIHVILHGVDLLFYISSLGIALNKGVLRDLSILSIVNFWAFSLCETFFDLKVQSAKEILRLGKTQKFGFSLDFP
jgi:hypothetical protein